MTIRKFEGFFRSRDEASSGSSHLSLAPMPILTSNLHSELSFGLFLEDRSLSSKGIIS